MKAGCSYQAVGFSYDIKADGSDDYMASDMHAVSSFRPPFPVPECLLDGLVSIWFFDVSILEY